VACPAPTQALIMDFTYAPVEAGTTPADTATFGDFTTTFSGGTYIYPTSGSYPLTSDVTASNWHIAGTVGDYSGLGLFIQNCGEVDASAYRGISFTVSGSVGTANTITFNVGTAADTIASAWLDAHDAGTGSVGFGRCLPASAQYDGSCANPSKTVPVTSTPTTIQLLWADLIGGKPQASVTPSEITFISWNFPPPAGVGTANVTTYAVDVTIDDVKFLE
jgi:hypothetical protein